MTKSLILQPPKENKRKKIKKTKEKELEEAAKKPESSELESEENATSREESESDEVDRKVKKATTKKRIGALKVNIKKTQGQSKHTSYRLCKVQVKGRKGS